jgi:uncharacterized protein YhdP
MKHILRQSLRSLWYCLAFFIIAIALILQLARLCFPQIEQFRDSLESYASQELKAQVSFGDLSANWYGLRPEIKISDLHVMSQEQLPLLEIDYAQMQLDILSSIFYWTPVWKKVDIQGLNIAVNQDAEGGWTVAGIAGSRQEAAAKEDNKGWEYRNPGALFLMANDVSIDSANITLQFHNQRQLVTRIPKIAIENDGHFHRLKAEAAIDEGSDFNFVLEGVGDPGDPQQFFATAYLQMNHFPIQRLVELFGHLSPQQKAPQQKAAQEQSALDQNSQEQLSQEQLSQKKLSQEQKESESSAGVDLELWFDFASPSRFVVNGYLLMENKELVASSSADKTVFDMPVSADINGDYAIANGLTLGLQNLSIDNDIEIKETLINLHDDKLRFLLPELDITKTISQVKQKTKDFEKINDVISTISPKGVLKHVELTVDLLDIKQSSLKANIVDGQANAWNNVPAFKSVNGYVESSLERGFILVDTQDFLMFPQEAYDEPLNFEKAKGYVGWNLALEENRIDIYGSDLAVSGPFGSANGVFLLEIPWQKQNEKSHLNLQIGLVDSKAEYYQQFVPKKLPEDLRNWMSESIKSGEVSQAGLFYRGGFSEGLTRSTQLFIDIQEGRLSFNKDWPEINNVDGRLIVDNTRANGKISRSSFYEGDEFSGVIDWNKFNNNNLVVNSRGESRGGNALRFVNESWLKTLTNGVFEDWTAAGPIELELEMSLPILDEDPIPETNINVQFNNNQINITRSRIDLDKVIGNISYSSQEGFKSKNLSVNVFEQTVPILFGGEESSSELMIVKAEGLASMSALADWLEVPVDDYASGNLKYALDFKVPLTDNDVVDQQANETRKEDETGKQKNTREQRITSRLSPHLNIRSELEGVSVFLPPPLSKATEELLPLSIDLTFNETDLVYSINYDRFLSANLVLPDENPIRLAIALSDHNAQLKRTKLDPGVSVDASLQKLDLDQWITFSQSFDQKQNDSILEGLPIRFSLLVDDVLFQDFTLNNFIVSGQREEDGWSVVADSQLLQGAVYIDNDQNSPIALNIDYLKWPPEKKLGELEKNKANEDDKDDWASWDLSVIPDAKVSIKQFIYDDKPMGEWSFDIVSDKNKLQVNNILASLGGFALIGNGKNNQGQQEGAQLHWVKSIVDNKETMSTQFSGSLIGEDFKTLTDQWQLPPILESEEAEFDLDLTWSGSPAYFDLERLKGSLDIHVKDGVFVEENTNKKTDALRLFGLLNFNTWTRRLRLDFSDVVKKGFVFDNVNGAINFDNGIVAFAEKPITVKSPSSKFTLSGVVDYNAKVVDADLVATLPIGGNLTLATALASGLPAAAGIYIVSKIFGKQLDEVSSINYKISGDLKSPQVATLTGPEDSENVATSDVLEETYN